MKKPLSLLIALCMAASLCACAGNPSESTPAPTGEVQKTVPPTGLPPETADPGSEVSVDSFIGTWTYREKNVSVTIFNDYTWERLDGDTSRVTRGTYRYDEAYGLVLEDESGSDVNFLRLNDDGTLYDSSFDVLAPNEGDNPLSYFIGEWEYENRNVRIFIYEDQTWERLDGDTNRVTRGTYRYDEQYGLVLENESGSDDNYLKYNDDGTLSDSVFDRLYEVRP